MEKGNWKDAKEKFRPYSELIQIAIGVGLAGLVLWGINRYMDGQRQEMREIMKENSLEALALQKDAEIKTQINHVQGDYKIYTGNTNNPYSR